MISEEDLAELPDQVGVYKKTGTASYHNIKRHGFGVCFNRDTSELVFGTWVPAGATLARIKVESVPEIVKVLEQMQDVVSYVKAKKKKEETSE